jgi:hypothetical protein
MSPRIRYFITIGVTAAACLGPGAQRGEAQQPLRVEGIYPRQLPIGQSTVISVVAPTMDELQPEIAPVAGRDGVERQAWRQFSGSEHVVGDRC